MVSAFAPSIINDSWAVAPFVVQVVACRREGCSWVLADLGDASHFYAGVPVPAEDAQGQGVVAQCLRLGMAAIAIVADGGGGFDVLSMADGK